MAWRTRLAAAFLSMLALALAIPAAAQAPLTLYGSAYAGSAGPSTLYKIDPNTGTASAIGPIGFNRVGALAYSKSGVLYGLGYDGTDSILIRINPATGAGALVGSTGVTDATQDMAFRSDGILFAYMGGSIYKVSTATGLATLVGSTGTFPDGNAIAFNGGTLLLSNTAGGANGSLQSVNQTTGAVTVIAPHTFGAGFNTANNPRVAGMKIDPTTGILFGAVIQDGGGRFLGQISLSGAVADVGATVAGLDAIAFANTVQIPTVSPAMLALMAAMMGAAAYHFLRDRRAVTGTRRPR
jgi:hypothetical protein